MKWINTIWHSAIFTINYTKFVIHFTFTFIS